MFSGRAAGTEKPFREERIMRTAKSIMTAVALAAVLVAGIGRSADPAPAQVRNQETVYGSQLMTNQERTEFQAKQRNAKTAREREQIRLEHHKAMQERAQAQGKSLPDMPPAMGGGMGPGGGGMGPGGGRNR
jgi:uncharacterized protein HemX